MPAASTDASNLVLFADSLAICIAFTAPGAEFTPTDGAGTLGVEGSNQGTGTGTGTNPESSRNWARNLDFLGLSLLLLLGLYTSNNSTVTLITLSFLQRLMVKPLEVWLRLILFNWESTLNSTWKEGIQSICLLMKENASIYTHSLSTAHVYIYKKYKTYNKMNISTRNTIDWHSFKMWDEINELPWNDRD